MATIDISDSGSSTDEYDNPVRRFLYGIVRSFYWVVLVGPAKTWGVLHAHTELLSDRASFAAKVILDLVIGFAVGALIGTAINMVFYMYEREIENNPLYAIAFTVFYLSLIMLGLAYIAGWTYEEQRQKLKTLHRWKNERNDVQVNFDDLNDD